MPPKRPTLADVRSWPATVSVVEAAEALGCSKTFLYERIKTGDSPVKTLSVGGRRYVVITADLVRLLSGEEREAA
ncbi:DNA-binding protein [Streptomyces virginiae]|uniref:DNA-binding protein n=1 Tax=Streptomyces virginiae TaxID=1961 RepID=UPI003657DE10